MKELNDACLESFYCIQYNASVKKSQGLCGYI